MDVDDRVIYGRRRGEVAVRLILGGLADSQNALHRLVATLAKGGPNVELGSWIVKEEPGVLVDPGSSLRPEIVGVVLHELR